MTTLVLFVYGLKHQYGSLIKSRQTLMLALTGLAGYLSYFSRDLNLSVLVQLLGSQLLTISGCTVLNMLIDRNLDRKMMRTCHRPLATGKVSGRRAATLGGGLLILGLSWSFTLSWLYFLLACVGAIGDVLVYTLWLKRRTSWSIVWGGIAGGIPVLAGRSLAVGQVDTVGLLLALAVVFWIPSHNLSLGMLHAQDYLQAGIPTFHCVYGYPVARIAVIVSSLLTAFTMAIAYIHLRYPSLAVLLLTCLSLGWVGLAIENSKHPSSSALSRLYKSSSLYLMGIMLILILDGVLKNV